MKDWEDLYKLHWACILELNRAGTRQKEMKRLSAGYGTNEVGDRQQCVSTHHDSVSTPPTSHDDTIPFTRRYDLEDRLNPRGYEQTESYLKNYMLHQLTQEPLGMPS